MNSMHFESSGSAQQQRDEGFSDKAPQETQPGEKRFSIILQAPESSNVTSHTQGMEEVDLMSSVPYNPAVNGDTRINEHKKAMNANDFDDFKL